MCASSSDRLRTLGEGRIINTTLIAARTCHDAGVWAWSGHFAYLQLKCERYFQRWPILYDKVWPNSVAYGTYSGEVAALKNWMADRVAYMDKNYLQK